MDQNNLAIKIISKKKCLKNAFLAIKLRWNGRVMINWIFFKNGNSRWNEMLRSEAIEFQHDVDFFFVLWLIFGGFKFDTSGSHSTLNIFWNFCAGELSGKRDNTCIFNCREEIAKVMKHSQRMPDLLFMINGQNLH